MKAGGLSIDHLADISEKLDAIIGFMSIRDIEGNTTAIVTRLHEAGFNTKVIARVSGLSENAIAIRLSRAKRKPVEKPDSRT